MGSIGTVEAESDAQAMSEHQKQTEFFKAMVQGDDTVEHRQLKDNILTAEKNERCVRRAIIKIAMLMALSFIGALYTLVMMPEVIFEANHSLRKVFQILALGSIMSLATYIGFWLYYRALLFQVHSDCRRFIMSKATEPVRREEVPSSVVTSGLQWVSINS